MELSGAHIHIQGIVQGVGFRPFVYGLATRLGLTGWVCNTSAGVKIQVDGPPAVLDVFALALKTDAPPLAQIDAIHTRPCPPEGFTTFEIVHSQAAPDDFQPISPDVCTCSDCLRELFDPADRRYRYPFINCTNCGPRFTIITDIPYDRPSTTMAGFDLCPQCAAEYSHPLDRRFHAQPVACPQCGPQVWLETGNQTSNPTGEDLQPHPIQGDAAILAAQELLSQGKILAIKGLGGFHLACDATNPAAVDELRRRKLRVDKPFALMLPDVPSIAKHCLVDPAAAELLQSHTRPIVILERSSGTSIARQTAPGNNSLGVMLPYTPLHYLLFAPHPGQPGLNPVQALVMTSGNLSEEPIATGNQEARTRLAGLADAFLMHNRPIHIRTDDSVVRIFPGISTVDPSPSQPVSLRRSRGYAPSPIHLPLDAPPLLAAGAELKNTFCLARNRYAFLSHHIGDLENYETLQAFEQGIAHFEKLFRIDPQIIACDMHPNYLASRYAHERAARQQIPLVNVQHHHAHIAAGMAEHHFPPGAIVIGVAFDGTGFGEDGAIWGGEFLVAGYAHYQRFAHLAYSPLPGGDAAIRHPARTALAHLWQAGLDWQPGLPPADALCAEDQILLRSQLEHRLNTPLTSSVGRLFDAAAALAGVRQKVNYEAQAAIEFEALADPRETGCYSFTWIEHKQAGPAHNRSGSNQPQFTISPAPLFHAMVEDIHNHHSIPVISGRFHNGVAIMVNNSVSRIRQETGLQDVVLSGGVWQNFTLLRKTVQLLSNAGFRVFTHHQIPPNDGGLAVGQAMVAMNQAAE